MRKTIHRQEYRGGVIWIKTFEVDDNHFHWQVEYGPQYHRDSEVFAPGAHNVETMVKYAKQMIDHLVERERIVLKGICIVIREERRQARA